MILLLLQLLQAHLTGFGATESPLLAGQDRLPGLYGKKLKAED